MTAAWPSTLPAAPVFGGFTEQRQTNVAAFNPDVGPPKYRRRSTAVGVPTSAIFWMTPTQVADFDTFFETTLVDGTLPFTWDHPLSGTNYTWMFDQSKGAPKKDYTNYGYSTITCELIRLP
jgi:hypothetical protein